MLLTVYTSSENQKKEAQSFVKDLNLPLLNGARAVNLMGADQDSVPGEVLEVMSLKKTGTFPLTTVDSTPIASGHLPREAQIAEYLAEGLQNVPALVSSAESAVDFPTASRMHISLDVKDLQTSVDFYRMFLNAEPKKRLEDYAKFETEEPPLNLALNYFQEPGDEEGHLNHFGIQVKTSDAVEEAKKRCQQAGHFVKEEEETACCYAVQTKFWVDDPDKNRWEVFLVTSDEADEGCGPDCICWQELEEEPAVA